MQTTDNHLIESALQGDRKAFELLFERYQHMVLNFVFHFLGDYGRAQEVTQSTFIAVYRNLSRYRPCDSARPWIFRIARNLAKNSYRDQYKYRKTLSIDEPFPDSDKSRYADQIEAKERGPREVLRAKELNEEIQKVIRALPEKYRTVLVLHDIEQVPYEEIQKIVRAPYQTVAGRLAKARLLFRKGFNMDRIRIYLYLFSNLLKEKMMKMTKWVYKKILLTEEKLSLYTDGKLDETQAKRIQSLAGEDRVLTEKIKNMEEVKIILSQSFSVVPRLAIEQSVMGVVFHEAPAKPSLGISFAVGLDALLETFLILPRWIWMALFAFVLGVSVTAGVIRTGQENLLNILNVSGYSQISIKGKEKTIRLKEQIKPGTLIRTGEKSQIVLEQSGKFKIEVGEKTWLMVKKIEGVKKEKESGFDMYQGSLTFHLTPAVPQDAFFLETPWFRVTHQGTIALIEQEPGGNFTASVLEGVIKLSPMGQGLEQKPITVKALEQMSFNSETKEITNPLQIHQTKLERILDFVPEQRIIFLALPEQNAASALVNPDGLKVAVSFYDERVIKNRKQWERIIQIFESKDRKQMKRAFPLIQRVARDYRIQGRLDVSSALELFNVAVSSYSGRDDKAHFILMRIAKEPKYSSNIRALALVALGRIYERHERFALAKSAYLKVLRYYSNTSFAREARERLQQLKA